MRMFANLFLILFIADGGFSLFDEAVSLLSPLSAISEIRALLANVVMVLAVGIYFCLGIDKRLPKQVFLPLVLFLFCCPISALFFPSLSAKPAYGPIMAAGQVFLSGWLIYRFRKPGERRVTIPEAVFRAPFFSLRNTLIFTAVNLILMPPVLVLLGLASANSYMEEHSSGFVRLAPGGLYMTEKVYCRNNKTIRLAAMIHVGEKRYFEELAGSLTPGRTIVLVEGVTDDDNLLQNKLDYGKVAGFLGLVTQEKLQFRGKLIGKDDLDRAASSAYVEEGGKAAEPVHLIRADVDISSFHPQTIHFLNALGLQLKGSGSMVKGLLSFNAWAQDNVTPEIEKIIMDDILHDRNIELIRHLKKSVDRYDTIVIPWGAMHMPEIEAAVLKQGFKLQQQREMVSIDLIKMLRGKL